MPYLRKQKLKTPTDRVIKAKKLDGKRWSKAQSSTTAYIHSQCSPTFQQNIPLPIIEIISIFHHNIHWQFHPIFNKKYPEITVSEDGQVADDLKNPKSNYKAINFGPILTYGIKYRCIFEIMATGGFVGKMAQTDMKREGVQYILPP